MKTYNWQTAFADTGAIGFVWLAAWLLLYRLPADHPNITTQELALIQDGSQPVRKLSDPKVPWLSLFGHRQTWGLMLGRFFSDPVWWFYLFWLPKYLADKRGFTMDQIGMLAWLPYITADLGAVFGGLLSRFLIKRNWEVLRARSAGMLPFALVMPISLLIIWTPSSAVVLLVICVVTFSHMAWKTNIMTITNDIYPTHGVGSVAGIVAFGNGLGGTLFTFLVGYIVQNYGYDSIFFMMGFMHPLAFVLFRWLVRKPVLV